MKFQFRTRQLLAITTVAAVACGVVAIIGLEGVGMLGFIWMFYAGIATLTTGPIVYLLRRSVRWYPLEALVLILPYAAWATLMCTDLRPKSLANIVEVFYFASATPVIAIMRAVGAKWLPNKACAIAFVATLCVIAIATYCLVPVLPE